MNTPSQDPQQNHPRPAFDWKRYWIRAALWALAFNIVAVLVTWLWILPRLHPEAFGG